MSLQIGTYLLAPGNIFLPMALLFFVAIARRDLRRHCEERQRRSNPLPLDVRPRVARSGLLLWRVRLLAMTERLSIPFVLTASVLSGLLCAVAYGSLLPAHQRLASDVWLSIPLGSFGAYWGALAGAMAAGRMAGLPAVMAGEAVVPGILAAGAVARVGCVFNGCCRGIAWQVAGVAPFRVWPVYDIAALVVTLGVVTRLRPGQRIPAFLALYGGQRLAIEFLRDDRQNILSVLLVLQVLFGLAWLFLGRKNDYENEKA